MNTLDAAKEAIKQKAEGLKKLEEQLKVQQQALSQILPVYHKALGEYRDEVNKEVMNAFKLVADEIVATIKTNDHVKDIQAIEEKIMAANGENAQDIMDELSKVVAAIQKIPQSDTSKMENALREGLESIGKLVVANAVEDPSSIEYRRNNGRISQVIETYSNYTVTHSWSYDREGNLVRITTETTK